MIGEMLIKVSEETQRRLIRLLPDSLIAFVLERLIVAAQTELRFILPLLGLLLQVSDAFNLQILMFFSTQKIKSQAQKLLTQCSVENLRALVRCLQAQPYLSDLWNFSSLFASETKISEEVDALVVHIKSTIYPQILLNESLENQAIRLRFIQALSINKREEQRCKSILTSSEVCDFRPVTALSESDLVQTDYLSQRVSRVLELMETDPFGHFAICGPQGCGKMSLLNLVNMAYQSKYNVKCGIVVVTLEETFDSKNLVGTYICNETGEFVFKKGPLTVAAEQGMWLVLRNIEDTPADLLSFLLPIVQENVLQVTSSWTIKPQLGFRIIVLAQQQDESIQHEDIKPLMAHLHSVTMHGLVSKDGTRQDYHTILTAKFPNLFRKINGVTIHQMMQDSISHLEAQLQQLKPHLLDFRPSTISQQLCVYMRVNAHFKNFNGTQLSQHQRQMIVEEVADVYIAWLYDQNLRQKLISNLIATQFNNADNSVLDGNMIGEYCTMLGREFGASDKDCFFGRVAMPRITQEICPSSTSFVYTNSTVRLLEQIGAGIVGRETVLLVGETGTGKTTAVQEISKLVGKKLHVFNMNQNTDSSDLLGGFKPVDLKYLLKPIYEQFLSVFLELFQKTPNNQKYLDLTQKCFEDNKVKEFCQCMQHGLTSIKQKKDVTLKAKTEVLERSIKDLQKRTKKLESGGGFIFQFVEGTLIKSMQNGDWILLDEINLASESVLNKLATIIQGNHILLNERADIVETKLHTDFRVFMCMNPPYSSAGKKQLPQQLRCKLQEIYVPELDNESDLWQIIDRNTKVMGSSILQEDQKRQVLQFYIQVKAAVQKQTKRGNIGLRNLCRALRFMTSAIQLKYPPIKAIYDSLYTCFASHLDQQMQEMVKMLIKKLFAIGNLPKLAIQNQKDERFAYIEDSLIQLGPFKPARFDENEFILTASFKHLLQQLASVISVSDFAVILEGPTSAGKTSCINYLAAVTHNRVIRINNHMHTDVQEYLGSYVPDPTSGKLVFQEGVLVEAVRKGYWVILDELNLAPSEVLEALNRLLDDNRELHIVETQKLVKAHPRFRIFATQNPTEGYGGRKELSEAFKNRFVMIKVRDVPTEELKEILEKKCRIPASRSCLMVKVMEELQIYRSSGNLFSGKDSTITVRDLLKWAGRVNANSELGTHMDQSAIALEGFLVLGERSRDSKDKSFIRQTIEKIFRTPVEIDDFYEQYFNDNLRSIFSQAGAELNLPKIILSKQLKRLATLVHKCLLNKEPVLLVGETGCGKTTLCQVFAHSVTKQPLMSINCHQNTETSDFIGCMRTRKNLSQTQDQLLLLIESLEAQFTHEQQSQSRLLSLKKRAAFVHQITSSKQIEQLQDDLSCVFEWTDGILVEAMQKGGLLLIDEISLANDSVLERLNSVFEHDRTLVVSEKSSQEAVKIVAAANFNMVATMNPGSDFGKKELSPALRNRLTEIWVESYFTQPELISLYADRVPIKTNVSNTVDLNLIVSELCLDQLGQGAEAIANGIFNMIGFLNFTMTQKYFSMQRKALSIRDILNMIDFLKRNTQGSKLLSEPLQLQSAFKHAVELVIIDGVCLGIDVTESEKLSIVEDCNTYLSLLLYHTFSGVGLQSTPAEYINTVAHIGVTPFVLPKQENTVKQSGYAFEANTTKNNLLKLLRAFTLAKPVLIEGPPGVGKTSLVENLARQAGKKLIRVNLSEQTDMMDLLGSEYPVASAEDEEEIKFSWCDGVLLQAIKQGYWFLIDEMNLAQQSILEGLNAILDHRRAVFIPELNQEFICHPDFFIFACQNPSQSSGQTSGRKTLPKSFLNRFTKIFLDDLLIEDYRVILKRQASDVFDGAKVESLLRVTARAGALTKNNPNADHSSVNMRDLSRFMTLYRSYLAQGDSEEVATAAALQICYFKDLTIAYEEKLLDHPLQVPLASAVRAVNDKVTFQSLRRTILTPQSLPSPKEQIVFGDFLDLKGPHSKFLQALTDCLQSNLPILVVTNDATRFQKNLQVIAKICQTKLKRILLNSRSDTTQLLGCFEQTSNDISAVMSKIMLLKNTLTKECLELEYNLSGADQLQKIDLIESFIRAHGLTDLEQHLRLLRSGSSRFEWVDSVLVQAIEQGHWAVFENANLCNPSILDRLNGLLEDGNQSLAINEQGLVNGTSLREVEMNPLFRAVFVITERTFNDLGKDVSRALRNRCLELKMHYHPSEMESITSFDTYDSIKVGPQMLASIQDKHDRLPISESKLPQAMIGSVKLGKRKYQNSEEYLSLIEAPRPVIAQNLQQPYPFYLPLLTQVSATPFQDYLTSETKNLQEQLKERISTQILERHLALYLQEISCASNYTPDFYLFLQSVIGLKSLRDVLADSFSIYLARKASLEMQCSDEFSFINGDFNYTILKDIQNQVSTLPAAYQKLASAPQTDIYVFKMPFQVLLALNKYESRVSVLMNQLRFNGATIILIDSNKDLIITDAKISAKLEESVFDIASVVETPNLVVVPKQLDQPVVVMSQSYIYETLCHLKDMIKLRNAKTIQKKNHRMTKIPVLLSLVDAQSTEAVIMRQIALENLKQQYGKPLDLTLLNAIMLDERTISLKDLPAAYACTHSLMHKLQQLQAETFPQAQAFETLAEKLELCDTKLLELLKSKMTVGDAKQVKAIEYMAHAFATLESMKTSEILRALFILPLEVKRQQSTFKLQQEEVDAERFFWQYTLRDQDEPERLLTPNLAKLSELNDQIEELLNLNTGTYSPSHLRHCLLFVQVVSQELVKLKACLIQGLLPNTDTICSLLFKQLDTIPFVHLNQILNDLLLCTMMVVSYIKPACGLFYGTDFNQNTYTLMQLKQSGSSMMMDIYKCAKATQSKNAQELQLKWLLKQLRLQPSDLDQARDDKITSAILEHFVQREVIKRMHVEESDVQIFELPFKVQNQDIPDVVGKAMDEWTKEDIAKMEAEANKQIEINFPSYFDEVQKAYYDGEFKRDREELQTFEEVPVEEIMQELLKVTPCEEAGYRDEYLRERLGILISVLEEDPHHKLLSEANLAVISDWSEDASAYLQHTLHSQKLKQVMNISELKLSSSYNFYHTPIASECKLIYQPLVQLLIRLRDITIRDEYESPLLNESIFLCNFMLTCFNAETTPLMKLLTSIEFLLSKLEEWENTYASKRLNSVETEINSLKMLVIRYRKIQILSWRNLLTWKRNRHINEDFGNCIRLAHTVARQVFELKDDVSKIFDLLDLYIRDSSLGLFETRLSFLQVLRNHLIVKQGQIVKMSPKMQERLQQVINVHQFVYEYYVQFKPKLNQTIERLDKDARDKIKTLIDVKKWTIQKFSTLKNNIDKTHRQLYRACKTEEEILLQNVQSLVLVASRKKFVNQKDELLSLDSENPKQKLPKTPGHASDIGICKQLAFLAQTKIFPLWPSCTSIQSSISGFMERLQEVRALNKKYLQKKAFYDLLKFFKDEGLRSNFNHDFQDLILQTRFQTPYFLKAYECFVMLKGSAQSEEHADLKGADVLRVQAFSQHLMHKLLELQLIVQDLQLQQQNLTIILPNHIADDQQSFNYTKNSIKVLERCLVQTKNVLVSTCDKLSIQKQMVSSDNPEKKAMIISLTQDLQKLLSQLPTLVIEGNAASTITNIINESLIKVNGPSELFSRRERQALVYANDQLIQIQNKFLEHRIPSEATQCQLQNKRHRKLESLVKVCYQDLFKLFDAKQRKESMDNSTTEGIHETELEDYTLEEQVSFSAKFRDLARDQLPIIVGLLQKITTFSKVAEIQDLASVRGAISVCQTLNQTLAHLVTLQTTYLESVAKMAYLTQRVFLYLIFQGFCGKEEVDDPEVEPPSDLEQDGMGMGDGQGKENKTDQIEHEEQLEGLKNYESDEEEKKEEKKEEKQEEGDEEENEFEMKEDFSGEMDSEQQEKSEKDKESDDDDELDNVDDMLDNQMWNQNMEDMEQQQEEKSEENRDVDLGDKEIEDENKMDHEDNNEAEGDQDEQQSDNDQKDKPEREEEGSEAKESVSEEGEREEDGDEQSEEEGSVHIDNETGPKPDEEFDESSQTESQGGEESKDNESMAEGSESEVDSKFEDDGQQQSQDGESDSAEDENGVKNNINQAVLEDEQIQATEANKDKSDQANLKRKQENEVEKSNNNQQQKQDSANSQKVDQSGADLLFQFAQQLQRKEQQKQEAQKKQQDKPAEKQVQEPNMVKPEQEMPPPVDGDDDQMADDFMLDDQAQKMEGKLATDQVEENAAEQKEDEPMEDEDNKMKDDMQQDARPEQQVEMTAKAAQELQKNENLLDKEENEEMKSPEPEEEITTQKDLIKLYDQYLVDKLSAQIFDLTLDKPELTNSETLILQQLDKFDYLRQKQMIREMFQKWASDPILSRQSLDLLCKFKNQTQHVSSSLCEQLRIVLEPQLSQNLQGDFKTGKRLNMKKVISFIASNYRNDKIWLRRTLPSKRDYKILIAIDDSLSMKESNLGFFSLEASVAITEALNRLEVGKVAVARIRDRLELVQSFDDSYTTERAAHIVSSFDFAHCAQTSADTSMANFVSDANKLLDMQNGGTTAVNCPFVIVLSDGRFNKDNVRRFMREAKEKRYLYIFVILDKKKQVGPKQTNDQGIMGMKSAVRSSTGQIKLEPYLKDFPFDYYCVVQDTEQLPAALGTILVQWFSMVSNS